MLTQPILRPAWEDLSRFYRDDRTADQLQEHYRVETALAERLRQASRDERRHLYHAVYDELFARLPHHPQLTQRRDDESYVRKQVAVLRRFLGPRTRYLEIGAGDARTCLRAAQLCRQATAVDVSDRVLVEERKPENFRFLQTDGVELPVPSGSVDFVYSNQLMEHLHPEDARDQLTEIARVLSPGGRYLCLTPSRLTGPHDVSRYFDDTARGFHLVEYTYRDLVPLFREVGFKSLSACIQRGGIYLGRIPVGLGLLLERGYWAMPRRVSARLGRNRVVRAVLGVSLLATKAA